jgi:Phage integrase family
MPRHKPLGWPRYMVTRRLKSGAIAYYWVIPSWAKRNGCPLVIEALGTDYADAKKRCDELLNPQLDAWRKREEIFLPSDHAEHGTFDWMVATYKSSPLYRKLLDKTRKSYDAALRLVSQHKLTDGRNFGVLPLNSITPGAADRLFARLKERPDGSERVRTAVLSVTVCKRAWNIARRDKPKIVPWENPFDKMELSYEPKPTRPVTHAELMRFVKAADEAGESSLGTAAMIAYYWLQREEDIIGRLSWSHYRPIDAPDVARIFHRKTGQLVDVPLHDEDGTVLWPELMERLHSAPRHGTLIVTRDRLDRRRKVHLPWKEDYFRHRVAEVRAAAGIDFNAKFMGLRHGGSTESGDADLTDTQMRALSGHKTASMTALYTKATMRQRQAGARKRLEARTKGGNLSK